jgi:hypothetical protein
MCDPDALAGMLPTKEYSEYGSGCHPPAKCLEAIDIWQNFNWQVVMPHQR